MDGNVVLALYEAGRWDEALTWVSDPAALSDLGFFQAVLVLVHLARGDQAAAESLQARAASLGDRDQPQFLGLYGEARARLLIRAGRPEEALELVLSIAETMRKTLSWRDATDLLLAGLEAAAAATAPERLEQLAALLDGSTRGRTRPAVAAVVEGERSRAAGTPDPAPWLIAAREWAMIGRPHDEAWAHLRAAEAVLAGRSGAAARRTAAEQLIAARRLAEDLGAVPLLEEIDQLARLARVDTGRRDAVADHGEPVQGTPALTDRERQVLALLADGRTNREIGAALYMSPKTASVHVTHILEKLGVESRVQAAALAVRLGLDQRS
jgi:DNA-binding CsgD family transcriptional regulator